MERFFERLAALCVIPAQWLGIEPYRPAVDHGFTAHTHMPEYPDACIRTDAAGNNTATDRSVCDHTEIGVRGQWKP